LTLLGYSKKWTVAAIVAVSVKAAITVFAPHVSSDFENWIGIASVAASAILHGTLPSVEKMGAYTGMAIFLAPFFIAWTASPIAHPPFLKAISQPYSIEGYSLILFMKLPILLFDLLAGIVIVRIVSNLRPKSAPVVAFFVWYLNPYPWYLMEYAGTFDIIPTAVLLLSVLFAMRGKWAGAGLFLAVASVLRVYPLLALPSFAVYVLAQHSRRAQIGFFGAFGAPIAVGVVAQVAVMGSMSAVFNSLLQLPARQPWLQNYYGFRVTTSLTLIPLILAVQVYLTARCWKKTHFALVESVLASLLIALTLAYHEPYHFTWILPLATVYLAVTRDSPFLFGLLLVSAFMSDLGVRTYTSEGLLVLLQPLSAGIFYATKAWYIIMANMKTLNPRIPALLKESMLGMRPPSGKPR